MFFLCVEGGEANALRKEYRLNNTFDALPSNEAKHTLINLRNFSIFLILYREIITIRAAEVCAVKLMVTVLLLVNNYVGLILQA